MSALLQYTKDSTYYFFSTSAQCVAALGGLSITLSIFRYQGLLSEITKKGEHIAKGLADFKRYLNPTESRTRDNIATFQESAEYWRDAVNLANDEQQGAKIKSTIQKSLPAGWSLDSEFSKFQSWRNEFLWLDNLVSQAKSFRLWVLGTSIYGLVVLTVGVLGTLFPVMHGPLIGGQVWAKFIYTFLLCIFIVLTTIISYKAFQTPWEIEKTFKRAKFYSE